jgi:hypothetical protein
MICGSDQLSVFEDVLGDIITMHSKVEKESFQLVSMSPEQQGRRLLVLFLKDLLADISGEVLENKSMQGRMVNMQPLEKWKKVLGYLFIASLDLGLLLYIVLFAMSQDKSRQIAWILSYVAWLVLEVVVVSSLVMLMSHFVVPSMMLSEIRATKAKMIDTIQEYQSKLLGVSTVHDVGVVEFNAAPFFFMSSRLALKFPGSIESEIIRDFKTDLPKRTYQRVKMTAMDMCRRRLRLTAIMLLLLSLERCFYDLICWAGIGFIILWHIVLLKKYSLLALIMYCTFCLAVGSYSYTHYKAAKILHQQARSSGVITLHAASKMSLESDFQGDADAKGRAIRDVVARFGRQRSGKILNPRFTRIMASLKESRLQQQNRAISRTNRGTHHGQRDDMSIKDASNMYTLSSSGSESSGDNSDGQLGLRAVLQRRKFLRDSTRDLEGGNNSSDVSRNINTDAKSDSEGNSDSRDSSDNSDSDNRGNTSSEKSNNSDSDYESDDSGYSSD